MDTTFIKIKKEFGGKNIIKKYIKQYIHKIPLPENIKKQITDETFWRENPNFYIDYPFLFLEKKNESDKQVKDLCVATGSLKAMVI